VINEAGIVLKNRNLWTESILPMILDYKANVLIGGTPKGKTVKRTKERHLFYELFERSERQEVKGKKDWESFNFTSYDNPLLDPKEIDELVKEISPALREQEINGKFVDAETSGIIKHDWWQYYENEDELYKQRVLKKVQSWDTAFKKNQENDYSVCTTWVIAQNGYYLIDLWRDRVEFPELKKKVVELYDKHKVNEILIEDKASGQSLLQELKSKTRLPIKAIKVEQDKIARVHAVTPVIEAGNIFLPQKARWLKTFTDECEDFPNGEYDDIVDTVSQLLNKERSKPEGDYKGIIHSEKRSLAKKFRQHLRTS